MKFSKKGEKRYFTSYIICVQLALMIRFVFIAVLISDEIERKFGQFQERKLLSQLTDPKWSEWHHSHSKNNRAEYDAVLRKREKNSSRNDTVRQ